MIRTWAEERSTRTISPCVYQVPSFGTWWVENRLVALMWLLCVRTVRLTGGELSSARQTARSNVCPATPLTPDHTISNHRAEAGTYCVYVLVSDAMANTPERANQDPAERPYKDIFVRVLSTQ
jgi:hypothetical protein